jgi:hypothetical protein
MKKTLLTISAFAVLFIVAMTLSAFTTTNNASTDEYNYSLAANDGWKVFRENVPYCDGGDKCMGTGTVWVNTNTYQVAFECCGCGKMDLSEYNKKEGYNMRFWHCSRSEYCYVNIFIPNAVFN